MRLAPDVLQALPDNVVRPGYAFAERVHGIVHLGIGAFHRAHQAVYTDDAMALDGGNWRITGVSLRSETVCRQLAPQHGLYTVTERSNGEPSARVIGSVERVLVAPREPQTVIEAIADTDTHIVTLTVTEKGYYRATDGGLDVGNKAIASELAGGEPQTIYGFLAHAFARRHAAGAAGLTLVSCDNMAENGTLLRSLLLAYLDALDGELRNWCEAHCKFPCSMVDRIVPASSESDLSELACRIGMDDLGAVFTEPFSQWVIEDSFASGRPAWEMAGAQLVEDVRPYETAKLRMLNGAHSALAYIGLLHGHEFVHQAIGDPRIRLLVDALMREEAATSFRPADGQDLEAYADALLARFDNPALNHRLIQIAMDGSQKIPQRWLATLSHHQNGGRICRVILRALAAWILHVRGTSHQVDDPMAQMLDQLWQEQGKAGIVRTLFGPDGLFAASFIANEQEMAILNAQLEKDIELAARC